MTSPAPLEARELYRFFRSGEDETLALRGVSLTVHAGELVAVEGPSGSGKSTLLHCLAGLDEPAGGSVWVAGNRMSHRPEHVRAALRARHIGVLFQAHNLLGHLTVAQNVDLAAALQPVAGCSTPLLLDRVGLAGRARAYPCQLSGGEAARAGLAVALVNAPDILLADEPTGELDGDSEQGVLGLLRDHVARGGAGVIVTHSSAVVAAADRVLAMRDGAVAA